ncbi:hypothetical protein IWX79_001267 [Janthinobacterium sp. CAN_S1]
MKGSHNIMRMEAAGFLRKSLPVRQKKGPR